ncbi:MAG: helix-turn-helix transcriptional regulator [Eubacteriales bacterium]|nr:helix-turn-helix transcriptional regulator [Eubacteriales bacterium]
MSVQKEVIMMQYPVIDVKATGKTMKELCRSRGISAKNIQEYMNFSNVQSIYNWFGGKTMPSLDNFYALSRLLGVSMEAMIVPSGTEEPDNLLHFDKELKKSA